MNISKNDLVNFVQKVDELGGPDHPDAQDYWSKFRYVPIVQVDTSLDCDGPAYHLQMLALYEEISGRQLDQKKTELTTVGVDALVDAESPYAYQTPSHRALHYLRLSKALLKAELPGKAKVLDMGCGWGLSSELLAQLGFKVSAVDINPSFVELVQRRAKRLGLDITARQATFDDCLVGPQKYDAVMFYECFHHAVTPKALLSDISHALTDEGKLILAGEPIQDLWWPQWGLRLDALSVYCIHKFGWFESGWSEAYLSRIMCANDLIPKFIDDPDPLVGRYVIATRSWALEMREWETLATPGDWWFEGDKAISNRNGTERSSLRLQKPKTATRVVFEMWNFSELEFYVTVEMGASKELIMLLRGHNELTLPCAGGDSAVECAFWCIPWSPGQMLGNGDERLLGFHLKAITYFA